MLTRCIPTLRNALRHFSPPLKPPKVVTITGGAGQISYALCFRIASGELLGKDQPLIIKLHDLPMFENSMKGVKMELEDCSLPLLKDIQYTTNLSTAFKEADYSFIIGAKPRGPGMERKDLLVVNAPIFRDVGKAINDNANRNIRVLVVANPVNTGCLIVAHHAKNISKSNFTCMTKLDHNRAKAQIALKTNVSTNDIKQVCVWGNHSATMYPDLRNALIKNRTAFALFEEAWIKNQFLPLIQQRGTAIINARKLSSAASAANAALIHMKEWIWGTNDWTSMGIYTEKRNAYGFPENLFFSMPVEVEYGKIHVIEGIKMFDQYSIQKIKETTDELLQERSAIESFLN